MRPIRIPSSLVERMATHARSTYPDECCGFLVAESDPADGRAPRTIVDAEAVPNDYEGERRRRFLLRPEELRKAERRLEGTGRAIAGFYHSHPDHPGRPSQYDLEHAWPWYTYVVLGIDASAVREARAFELDPDALVFREVAMAVEDDVPAAAEVVGGLARP